MSPKKLCDCALVISKRFRQLLAADLLSHYDMSFDDRLNVFLHG